MREFIIRRLLLVVPIMIGVSFLTFVVFSMIPGDAAEMACGFGCTPETVEALRKDRGLDRPWYEQYWDWMSGVFQGDFGTSLTEGRLPVATELERRLPVTAQLTVLTLLLSLVLGVPPGILSAIRPGTLIDWFARFVSVLWLSIPSFYLGILLLTFGFIWFGWSPPQFETGTTVSIFEDPWLNLQQFFFPSFVLATGTAAVIMRLTRSAMLEVMRNDYIRTAWSKGLRERTVVYRHALKNAFIPVVTIIGLQLGALLGGAVLVEMVFGLNGVGLYLLESVLRRDFIVVQSLVLLFALAYVTANLLVDLAYAWLDPRIRYG
jgi:peptide/nickel transport system permease protein